MSNFLQSFEAENALDSTILNGLFALYILLFHVHLCLGLMNFVSITFFGEKFLSYRGELILAHSPASSITTRNMQ